MTESADAPPTSGVDVTGDWVALATDELDVGLAAAWAVVPSCGAVVTFSGTVRDHAEGREGVTTLEYEAYEEHVVARLEAICDVARARWPLTGRLVLWHRIGRLGLGEVSVVTAASAPHRPEAFAVARFLIDAVKSTVPIWKHETWDGGSAWSECTHDVDDAALDDDERAALADVAARIPLGDTSAPSAP